MKNKVDKGFKLNYWNLSYRRKFIRTLWQIPLVLLAIGLSILTVDNIFFNRIVPILLVIILIWQLIYNYTKWKNDEQ